MIDPILAKRQMVYHRPAPVPFEPVVGWWRALLSPETLERLVLAEQGRPLPDRGDLAHRPATTGDRSVLNGLETAVAVAGKPLERGETS